jgi:uncharacterized membrane protein YcjF (UPF0283 family)
MSVMHLSDPLARPWAALRSVCLWVAIVAWVTFWVNGLAAKLDWVRSTSLVVVMIAVLAVMPIQILGRRKLRQSEPVSRSNH